MAKTINRVPFTVKTDPDIDYKFFAHGNWNGICTDKNYFNIDQETFEDANNVYIDSNGVLSSRPTVQPVLDVRNLPDTGIQRQWQFGDVIVRQLVDGELYFYKQGNLVSMSIDSVSDTAYIIENDGKLFIFDNVSNRIDSYNKSTNRYIEGCNVYIPIKYAYTNMIKSTIVESPNILTDAYIDRYLYSNPSNGNGSYVNFEMLKNETAVITLNDERYPTRLDSYIPHILFEKYVKLPSNVSYEYTSSGGDLTIFCTKTEVTTSDITTYTWTIYYTLNGTNYELFDTISNCLSVPVISADGSMIAVVVRDLSTGGSHLKVKSTITPGITNYTDWTNITEFNSDDARSHNKSSVSIIDENIYSIICYDGEDDDAYINYYVQIGDNQSQGTIYTGSYYYDFPTTYMRAFSNDTCCVAFATKTLITYIYVTPESVSNTTMNTISSLITGETTTKYNFFDVYDDGIGLITNYTIRLGNLLNTEWIAQYFHRKSFLDDDEDSLTVRFIYREVPSEPGQIFAVDIRNNLLYCENYMCSLSFNADNLLESVQVHNYLKDIVSGVMINNYAIVLGSDGYLYSTVINDEIPIDIERSKNGIFIPEITLHTELNGHYVAFNEDGKHKIAISSVGSNTDEFLWYFPERDVETFTNDIVDIHPISTSEMGVFLENEVWYIGQTESGHYTYTKSKLPLGCKKGSNVISSYDGKNLMMLTERGFVALSYQDFVASTDQVLSFLSDSIDEIFIPYIKKNICKLYKHKYWILVYSDSTTMYIYDIRNGSWWKWTLPSGVSYPITVNDEVSFVNSTLYKFTNEYEEYKDYNDNNIDWYIVSQKLHLNTLNYYKRLVNMTLNSLHAKDETQKMILSTTNYRDKSYEGLTSKPGTNNTLDYDVDLLRTYVKRLNYGKLVEFQYKLRNNERVELQPQLKLNSIIIKYVITGVIR